MSLVNPSSAHYGMGGSCLLTSSLFCDSILLGVSQLLSQLSYPSRFWWLGDRPLTGGLVILFVSKSYNYFDYVYKVLTGCGKYAIVTVVMKRPEITTIQLKRETKAMLDYIGVKGDTYNDIIERLLAMSDSTIAMLKLKEVTGRLEGE